MIAQKFMNVNPDVWGSDAYVFRPECWIQYSQHKYYDGGLPVAVTEGSGSGWGHLMTFSVGPRNCIGYRMALVEFKVGLAVGSSSSSTRRWRMFTERFRSLTDQESRERMNTACLVGSKL